MTYKKKLNKNAHLLSLLPSIIFSISMCILIIIFSKESSKGALNGVNYCMNILIPSLFPFMVLSSFIVNSGISTAIKPLFKVFMKFFLGLPGECGPIFFLSLVGGYPVGAKGIAQLYKKKIISTQDAVRMAYLCVCAGPGFLITFVGTSLLSNKKLGLILFISQVLSVLIIGIVTNIFNIIKSNKNKKHEFYNKKNLNTHIITTSKTSIKKIDFSQALVESTSDSIFAMINTCGMVVVFSSFIAIINAFLNTQNARAIIQIIFEVTSACSVLSKNYSVEIIAFAIGFGGLCVHFQIFSFLSDVPFNKMIFMLYRILCGIITSLTVYIILFFSPVATPVFSSSSSINFMQSTTSATGSISLIICAICFLASIKNIKNN